MTYLSRGNRKLSEKIAIFNLPRLVTCPGAGKCKEYCYEKKIECMYEQVVDSRTRNYRYTKLDSFPLMMYGKIQNMGDIDYVRIHESGDFYDQEYLDKWKLVSLLFANGEKDTTFYAYTKSFKLDLWEYLPSNFKIIQSYGSKYDHLIDPNKSTARVIDSEDDVNDNEYFCPFHKEDFTQCGEYCNYCMSDDVKHICFMKH